MTAQARAQLVQRLKSNGSIRSAAVEAAFLNVPRHVFLPDEDPEAVYADQVFITKFDDNNVPISSSSQPTIMAIMLEQLDLQPGHKVLEIGAGTGYNAALIGHIVGEAGSVHTLDIDEDIVVAAKSHLNNASMVNVYPICTDGYIGYADAAPYDRIILSVNAWDITPAWRDQLKPEGVIVLPLTVASTQVSVAFVWRSDYLQSRSIHRCGFMPFRGKFTAPEEMQMLKLMEGISAEISEDLDIQSETILNWLKGPHTDVPLGLSASLSSSLNTWLSLQDGNRVYVSAAGDAVGQGIVPYLNGVNGEKGKFMSTAGQIASGGMVLLMRPPSESLPEDMDFYGEFPWYMRSYGKSGQLAAQLSRQIERWDRIGRPPVSKMRLKMIPDSVPYQPQKGDMSIAKHWNTLVINWQ